MKPEQPRCQRRVRLPELANPANFRIDLFRLAFFILALSGWLALAGGFALAQNNQSRRVPKAEYFATVQLLRLGEFEDGFDLARDAKRRVIKTAQSRWIDSICAHTVAGELYYETGQLPKAMDEYTAALHLAARFPDWLLDLNLPQTLRPVGSVRPAPWERAAGLSQPPSRPAHFPDVFLIRQGKMVDKQQLARGGIFKPPVLFPVIATEIVHCTAHALRRRRELLGPAAHHDALSATLVANWTQAERPKGQWVGVWLDLQLGLAYTASGKDRLAKTLLARSLQIQGMDHTLTAHALCELARMEMEAGDHQQAIALYGRAASVSFQFGQAELLEDAFRGAHLAYILSGQPGVLPSLEPAAAWAKKKDLHKLEAALRICLADAALDNGQPAEELLARAAQAMKGTELIAGRHGAWWQFHTAAALHARGRPAEAEAALAAALEYGRRGSLWAWHIFFIDRLYQQHAFSTREALDLYRRVLHEPSSADWRTRPLETLSVITTPHRPMLVRWFQAALFRKKPKAALEIAELARREQFYTTLPLGGRLLALRWLLHGPTQGLPQEAKLERMDFLGLRPGYDLSIKRTEQLTQELRQLPVLPGDQGEVQRRRKALGALAVVTAKQEQILRHMALRRIPATRLFPRLRGVEEVQGLLPPRQAVLAFFATDSQVYGFLISFDEVRVWEAGRPEDLFARVQRLLRELGNTGPERQLDWEQLHQPLWQQTAGELLIQLTGGLDESDWYTQYDEICVVPDWALWYVPFEILSPRTSLAGADPWPNHLKQRRFAPDATQEGRSPEGRSPGGKSARDISLAKSEERIDLQLTGMILRTRIRYAPTIGTAVRSVSTSRPNGPTVVTLGRVFPQDESALAEQTLQRLSRRVSESVALPSDPGSAVGLSVSTFDRLLVLAELRSAAHMLQLKPIPLADPKQPSATLGDWLQLPFAGPRQVIMPGFRSAAEHGLRGTAPTAAGLDVFLPACSLLASGSQTVLLSRWRTGGATCHDLMREFLQELPNTTPADAWQRSVLLVGHHPIDPLSEPRLEIPVNTRRPPRAAHPFLWSGYLLLDSGPTAGQPLQAGRNAQAHPFFGPRFGVWKKESKVVDQKLRDRG